MPGIVGVDVEFLNQINRLARQEQIGRTAIFMVVCTRAVWFVKIEMATKPIDGIIGVT